MRHPDTKWSTVSSNFSQNRHFESVPFLTILAWYFLVKRPSSAAGIIKPSVSAFTPALRTHWWVFPWSLSVFWLRSGHFPCRGLFSQFCLICLSPSVLAVFLVSLTCFVEVFMSFFSFWCIFTSYLLL